MTHHGRIIILLVSIHFFRAEISHVMLKSSTPSGWASAPPHRMLPPDWAAGVSPTTVRCQLRCLKIDQNIYINAKSWSTTAQETRKEHGRDLIRLGLSKTCKDIIGLKPILRGWWAPLLCLCYQVTVLMRFSSRSTCFSFTIIPKSSTAKQGRASKECKVNLLLDLTTAIRHPLKRSKEHKCSLERCVLSSIFPKWKYLRHFRHVSTLRTLKGKNWSYFPRKWGNIAGNKSKYLSGRTSNHLIQGSIKSHNEQKKPNMFPPTPTLAQEHTVWYTCHILSPEDE